MNESTPSAVIQILESIKQSIDFTTLIIGGITFACGLYFRGFTKERFDNRARVVKHKLNVARHVLEICGEASTNHFATAPRDMEHIHSVLTNVEGFDKKVEVVMNSFISKWQMLVTMKNTKGLNNDGAKYTAELMIEIEKDRKTLIEWANKIRVGKKYIFWY
jgi:hypothetical protein